MGSPALDQALPEDSIPYSNLTTCGVCGWGWAGAETPDLAREASTSLSALEDTYKSSWGSVI